VLTLSDFQWIIVTGLLMSALACIGALTFFLNEARMKKFLHFFVALAAGSLLGGALFHLLPAALQLNNPIHLVLLSMAAGFTLLLLIEQILLWHSSTLTIKSKKPLGYLILLADGIHNFIGGIGIGAALIMDIKIGLTAWFAALLHELPQELGDFGILVESGWSKGKALLMNFLSALTFPIGGIVVYFLSDTMDVSLLMPFAAGNFLYIAASGLIPEIKQHTQLGHALMNFAVFVIGLMSVYLASFL
jgi:zinc and cadmium transporter